MSLGRPRQGEHLPLSITCTVGDTPTAPDAAPTVYLYRAGTLITSARLSPVERQRVTGRFAENLFLNHLFTPGNYIAAYKYAVSSTTYQKYDSFEVTTGDSKGEAISLREYRKPGTVHILQHFQNGRVDIGKNPQT